MATSRHSVDVFQGHRRSLNLSPSHGGFSSHRKSLGSVSIESGADLHRRRSFHGGDLKRDLQTTEASSVVGLGCSKGSLKVSLQHVRHKTPEKITDRDDHKSNHGSKSMGIRSRPKRLKSLTKLGDKAPLVEGKQPSETDSPVVFLCSLPREVTRNLVSKPTVNNATPTGMVGRTNLQSLNAQHATKGNKSRRLQKQGVKDLEIAIHRLSTRLKRMDLDEVLIAPQCREYGDDYEACDVDLKQSYPIFKKEDDTLGMGSTEMNSAKAQKRKYHGLKHGDILLRRYLEDAMSQADSREGHTNGSFQVYPEKNYYPGTVYKDRMFVDNDTKVEEEWLENRVKCEEDKHDDGMIKVHLTDKPMEAGVGEQEFHNTQIAESNSADEPQKMKHGNVKDGQGSPTPVPYVAKHSRIASASQLCTSQVGVIASSAMVHSVVYRDSNVASSPCFAELLLSSSDIALPSSETSSELSEALQNLSGNQAHKEVKANDCQQNHSKEKLTEPSSCVSEGSHKQNLGSNEIGPSTNFGPSTNGNDPSSTLTECERALLWVHEQNSAPQKRGISIDDPALILTRLGRFVLSSIPCEGMQMVASEPFFHETIKVARAFLRVLALYVTESCVTLSDLKYQRQQPTHDDDVRPIHVPSLGNVCFARRHHIRYGVQGLISELIFDQFNKPSYSGKNRHADWWVFLVEFQRLAMVAPLYAIDISSKFHDQWFHRFCSTKLQLVQDKMPKFRWPDYLLQAFLDAMKYVWQAHLIAQASLDSICLFRVNEWSQYDSAVMEVADHDHDATEFVSKVQFMLSPGFKLQGSIVKSEVYLIPKVQSDG